MLKTGQKFNYLLLGVLLLLMGCVAGEGGKKKANCGDGQEFDSTSRSCRGAVVTEQPPNPSLSGKSFSEDAGATDVELLYADINSDKATACEVTSPNGDGIRKSHFHNGIEYKSNTDVTDPHQYLIQIQNTGILSVTTSTLGAFNYITITINEGFTSNLAVATAVNGDGDDDCSDGDASCWISANLISAVNAESITGAEPLDELDCECVGGVCSVEVTPVDHYYGVSSFTYNLTDNDGQSVDKIVTLNIASVNDDPSVVVTTGILNVTEDVTSAGTLATDAGFSVEDTADGDPFGAFLTYEVVTPPANGTLTLFSTGAYTYLADTDWNGADSFVFRVCDSDNACSANTTITVNVAAVADAPVGTLSSISNFDEDTSAEGGTEIVTLTYTDAESDAAVSCAITATSGVYISQDCACAAGVCTVGITGFGHNTGASYFDYTVTTGVAPTTSVAERVSFSLNAISDNPIARGDISTATSVEDGVSTAALDGENNIQFNESSTHIPNYVDFTLNSASDPDGDSVSYTVVTDPSNGVITNCLSYSGSTGSSDLSCRYTPNDGNMNDGATIDIATDTGNGSVAVGDVTFHSARIGDSSSDISVELIDADGIGGSEFAWVDGNTVKILYEAGVTTPANIDTVIDSSTDDTIQSLLYVSTSGATVLAAGDEGTYTLSAGTATADKFVIKATDANTNDSSDKDIHFSIVAVDDRPSICEYSSYADTTVCGLNGCIGSGAPTSITPDQSGLSYYDTSTGACWVSDTSSWSLVESHIADLSVNELNLIIIDKIKIDEGGGDAGEDSQRIRITDVDSSDTNLLPLGNIYFEYSHNGTDDCRVYTNTGCDGATIDAGTPADIGDAADSDDDNDFKIYLKPADNQTGTSEIEITFSDGTNTTEVIFNLTVNDKSAVHGGWVTLSATGPKVNTRGQVTETRDVCPYSRDLCESGQECSGSSSPVNNTSADPDHVNAVFLQESGTTQTCYRIKRTNVEYMAFIPKTSSYVDLVLEDSATAGSETIATSGTGSAGDPYVITVGMQDDASTTNQIITAIEGDTTADALVKIVNLKPTETVDVASQFSIGNLSNSNWESFTTSCHVTPTDFESACSTYGDTCMGSGAPTVTPTAKDSRYWDEQNNVCYRSIDTTGAGDWVAYEAPAEITLTWNQFTVSGAGSIDQYNVYRRLPGDSFDFDSPINRVTINGSSSTYTYKDNGMYSFNPPTPGTVYFYEVRPVVDGVVTATSLDPADTEVRMVAPPKNMAFVHRWMVNKTMCTLMNKTPESQSDNYRCEYTGPGDMTSGGKFYYDIQQDFLVDRQEAGCAYSLAPTCNETSTGSCIGTQDPTSAGVSAVNAGNGAVYYSRDEGKCYLSNGAAWSQITTTALVDNYLAAQDNAATNTIDKVYNRSQLPPFVHITQESAHHFCRNLTDLDGDEILGFNAGAYTYKLPTRKEQIAISTWDSETYTDSEVATKETGLSLNSNSKCNSSGASGIDSSYTDIEVPDSNNFFSLPGSDTSDIRSVITGSDVTADCQSKYGIQDLVGNVAEWSTDRINCVDNIAGPSTGLSSCSVSTAGNALADSVTADYASVSGDSYGTWAIDGTKGPCVDTDGDDVCDSAIENWAFEDERFDAGRFIMPLGLPAHVDWPSDNPTSEVELFEIGPTSGITSLMLHDDTVGIYSQRIFAAAGGAGGQYCGGLAYGGHYGSGNGAGVWAMEYLPCGNDSLGTITIQDISLRAIGVDPDNMRLHFVETTATLDVNVTGTGTSGDPYIIEVDLDNDTPAANTATGVAAAINADVAAQVISEAVVSGIGTNTQAAYATAQSFTDHQEDAENNRVDVGFRCLIPLTPSTDYEE